MPNLLEAPSKPETPETRMLQSIAGILDGIPEEMIVLKSDQEFRDGIVKAMTEGYKSLTDRQMSKVKQAQADGIIPGDIEMKAWASAYPTEEHLIELEQRKHTALKAGDRLAGDFVSELFNSDKYRKIAEDYFEEEQPADMTAVAGTKGDMKPVASDDEKFENFMKQFGVAHPDDPEASKRLAKGIANATDEVLKAIGYQPGEPYREPEDFINFAIPADLQKFADASMVDKFRYMMSTFQGYGDVFVRNVVEFMGKMPEMLTGPTKSDLAKMDKGEAETKGKAVNRMVQLAEGFIRPLANWLIYLGLNTAYPIGSGRWQQAVQEIMADPITHTAFVMDPIRRMRNKYDRLKSAPENPIQADLIRSKAEIESAETYYQRAVARMDEAVKSGDEAAIMQADKALKEAKELLGNKQFMYESQKMMAEAGAEVRDLAKARNEELLAEYKLSEAQKAGDQSAITEAQTALENAQKTAQEAQGKVQFEKPTTETPKPEVAPVKGKNVISRGELLNQVEPYWKNRFESPEMLKSGSYQKVTMDLSKWSHDPNKGVPGISVDGRSFGEGKSRTPGPPIIDEVGYGEISIIDGWHRIKEALARGDKTIDVYVGDKGLPILKEHHKVTEVAPVKGEPGGKIVTGLDSADAARNLAHQKNALLEAEVYQKTLTDPAKIAEHQEYIDRLKADIPKAQEAYDQAIENFIKEQDFPDTPAEVPPEGPPPATPAEVPADMASTPSIFTAREPRGIGFSRFIGTPSNIFGAIPGQEARYGRAAQAVQRKFNLTDRDIMIETNVRQEQISDLLSRVDKKDWGKNGDAFYDAYESIVNPDLPTLDVAQGTVDAANVLHRFLETDRKYILEMKRAEIEPSVARIVENDFMAEAPHGIGRFRKAWKEDTYRKQWRAANNFQKGQRMNAGDKARFESDYGQYQQMVVNFGDAVRAAVEEQIPNWGIDYYLPQMHPGQYAIYTDIGGMGQYVGSAKTPGQAKQFILEDFANRRARGEEVLPDSYQIAKKAFKGADVLRVSDPRFFQIVKEIATQAEEFGVEVDAMQALRGVVGRKSARQKFAGFLQKRTGAEGFSKDITKSLSFYNQQFVRWKRMTDMNKQVEPLLQYIERTEHKSVGAYLRSELDYFWGGPAGELSKAFDATLQRIPIVKDHVYPAALDRWMANYVKRPMALMFLELNPRFHLLNRMQTFQTLAPNVTAKEFAQGRFFYNSEAGQAALKKFGIPYISSRGKIAEAGRALLPKEVYEAASKVHVGPFKGGLDFERFNQEVAYATMFKKAKDMGMSDAAANDYSFLRGTLYTQFAYLKTDMPALFRGPVASTAFLFKRFQIKNIEMGLDLIRDKNYPGLGKWFGAQVALGGWKAIAKGYGIGTGLEIAGIDVPWMEAEVYEEIKKEYGEEAANTIALGLPGLIGLDMSYSIQLFDTPYGETMQEKIGNFALGPVGQTAVSVYEKAKDTKGLEGSAVERGLSAVTQKIPALKWIDASRALFNEVDEGKYMFRDPAGRGRFKADLKDLIVKALGGRTTEEAEIDMLVGAMTFVIGERDAAMDEGVFALERAMEAYEKDGIEASEEGYADLSDVMLDWNEKWPEFPIYKDAIDKRWLSRNPDRDKDRFERFMENAPKYFRGADIYIRRMEQQEEEAGGAIPNQRAVGDQKPQSFEMNHADSIEALREYFNAKTSIDRSKSEED